ncbi:MAG: nitrilase-related carbon-nitrogen hydrolase [Limisphaerales bacterium]
MKTDEELNLRSAAIYAAGGVAAFHLAYHSTALALMIGFYLFAVASLLRLGTARKAFYLGAAVGFGVYAPPLEFFWTIFGPAAMALWAVLAFWHGLFVAVARQCRVRFGWQWAVLLLPFLWTGIEYFRSEVYHLRFSWLSAGFAFADSELYSPFRWLGVYGIGFLLMTLVSGLLLARNFRTLMACGLTVVVAALSLLVPGESKHEKGSAVQVAGIQMEFPIHAELMAGLDRLVVEEPNAELIVLSEYTFPGAIPKDVKEWCRTHRRYMIVGGKDETEGRAFYNTAFVIGPEGEVVFQQAKSVPIQFMDDGLPAERQKVWDSPWGKLGIGICYDLSYRDVMDQFVEQGAEALIIPTMDVQDWGQEQHDLHARVAPMRSMEYGLPIVRLASSGVSQLTTPEGVVEADAPFPGQHRILSGKLKLSGAGVIPVDRFLAPLSYCITAALMLFLVLEPVGKRLIAGTGLRCNLCFDPKPALRMLAFPWQLYRLANGANR